MPSTITVVAIATAVLAVYLYRQYAQTIDKNADPKGIAALPLPPGPKGIPIFGMTAKVLAPGKKHASLFEDWEKHYGQGKGILLVPTLFRKQVIIRQVSSATVRARLIVPDSDAKAAQALLEKRGTLYAWRAVGPRRSMRC